MKKIILPLAVGACVAFAVMLKNYPNYNAIIEAYTDSAGSSKANQILSEKRAKAVYNKLIELGVSKDKMGYVGYGEESPIADNTIKEGRAKNRRIKAKLVNK